MTPADNNLAALSAMSDSMTHLCVTPTNPMSEVGRGANAESILAKQSP
jgi:hypothetical protein